MKLYTTVTSERATKGQGGNKQLNLAIYIDDRKSPRFRMFITKREDDSTDVVLADMEKPYPNEVYNETIKGKRENNICHLCSSPTIKGGWCTNKTCSEYNKYVREDNTKGEKKKDEYCQAQVEKHLCHNKVYKDALCKKHYKMFNS